MIYFIMQELIGCNSADAYEYYLHKIKWLEENLSSDRWSLDCSHYIYVNGFNIPCGIMVNEFSDAYRFCRGCI